MHLQWQHLMETIGSGAVTAPVSEIKNADVAIVIGARPTQNHPVAATFMKNAVKNNGLKLIIMDPRKQDLSRIAEKKSSIYTWRRCRTAKCNDKYYR